MIAIFGLADWYARKRTEENKKDYDRRIRELERGKYALDSSLKLITTHSYYKVKKMAEENYKMEETLRAVRKQEEKLLAIKKSKIEAVLNPERKFFGKTLESQINQLKIKYDFALYTGMGHIVVGSSSSKEGIEEFLTEHKYAKNWAEWVNEDNIGKVIVVPPQTMGGFDYIFAYRCNYKGLAPEKKKFQHEPLYKSTLLGDLENLNK